MSEYSEYLQLWNPSAEYFTTFIAINSYNVYIYTYSALSCSYIYSFLKIDVKMWPPPPKTRNTSTVICLRSNANEISLKLHYNPDLHNIRRNKTQILSFTLKMLLLLIDCWMADSCCQQRKRKQSIVSWSAWLIFNVSPPQNKVQKMPDLLTLKRCWNQGSYVPSHQRRGLCVCVCVLQQRWWMPPQPGHLYALIPQLAQWWSWRRSNKGKQHGLR